MNHMGTSWWHGNPGHIFILHLLQRMTFKIVDNYTCFLYERRQFSLGILSNQTAYWTTVSGKNKSYYPLLILLIFESVSKTIYFLCLNVMHWKFNALILWRITMAGFLFFRLLSILRHTKCDSTHQALVGLHSATFLLKTITGFKLQDCRKYCHIHNLKVEITSHPFWVLKGGFSSVGIE